MNVAGKLRYATSDGEQNTVPDAEVVGFRSDSPAMVVVKLEGETSTFQSMKYAEKDLESGMIYISGKKFMERVEGEIVRVRKEKL